MSVLLPSVNHVYQNHTLDSTRWDRFVPRNDDIVVAPPYKSGTTWMQAIVMHLVFQDLQPHDVNEFSPWFDNCISPLDEVISKIEAQQRRRCIKSHLPLDGLRYLPQAKYIVVGRDARDVFMSMWNHYFNFAPEVYRFTNEAPNLVGAPMPPCPTDIREFWHEWITRGWFDWESEGNPFWSNLHHIQTWWNYRQLPNILFVHYYDLLHDLPGEIRRIADYLGIEVAPESLEVIAELVTFSTMKKNAELILPGAANIWVGGAQTFIHKGTNGRWRQVLTDEDLELYEPL